MHTGSTARSGIASGPPRPVRGGSRRSGAMPACGGSSATKSGEARATPLVLSQSIHPNQPRSGGDDRLAERQGFEPWRRVTAYTRSRRAPSTTRPPLPTATLLSILLQLQGPSNNRHCPPGRCGIRATTATPGLDSQFLHSNIAGTNSTATRSMPTRHPGK